MNDESQGRNIIVVMCFLFLYIFIKCIILHRKGSTIFTNTKYFVNFCLKKILLILFRGAKIGSETAK